MEIHNIPPIFDENSKILILGSFPSVKSREEMFYYAHPRNRFWPVLAAVMGWPEIPAAAEEKKARLLSDGIALWDVIASCEIEGSSDNSIRNVIPNKLEVITGKADIRAIYCGGSKPYELYMKYIYPVSGRTAEKLPSTSPANASRSLDALVDAWKIIRKPLEKEEKI